MEPSRQKLVHDVLKAVQDCYSAQRTREIARRIAEKEFGEVKRDHRNFESVFVAELIRHVRRSESEPAVTIKMFQEHPGRYWDPDKGLVYGKPMPELIADAKSFADSIGLNVEVYDSFGGIKCARFTVKKSAA